MSASTSAPAAPAPAAAPTNPASGQPAGFAQTGGQSLSDNSIQTGGSAQPSASGGPPAEVASWLQSQGWTPPQTQAAAPSPAQTRDIGTWFDQLAGTMPDLNMSDYFADGNWSAEGGQRYESAKVARQNDIAFRQAVRDAVSGPLKFDGLAIPPVSSEGELRTMLQFVDRLRKGNVDPQQAMQLYRLQGLVDAARAEGTRSASSSVQGLQAQQLRDLAPTQPPSQGGMVPSPASPAAPSAGGLVNFDPTTMPNMRGQSVARGSLFPSIEQSLNEIQPGLGSRFKEDPSILHKTLADINQGQ